MLTLVVSITLGFCQKANISPVTATWADLARYVGDLRERQDGRHSPSEVLRGVLGRTYAEEVLSRVLHTTQFTRHLNRHGYIKFKHWRLFGENGLAGEDVSVWVCEETLKIEYRATTLALYSLTFQRGSKQIAEVKNPHRIQTFFRSPQLDLWQLSDTSGFWLCGDQSRSHGRNRARSFLLRDNSCYLSLVRLDRYLYQVMSIEVEVLACLPRYSISSPHSIPIE